jgi:plasmid stabilization system protein ParE
MALKDRDEIFDYIESDNPRAAVEVDLRIKGQTETLIGVSGRPDVLAAFAVQGNS